MVLAGPRVLVVGVMTRRTATARQNAAAGQQSALFGDPTPAPNPPTDHPDEGSGRAATAPAGPTQRRSDRDDRAPARSTASAGQDPRDTL
jgi:hypothetical protein